MLTDLIGLALALLFAAAGFVYGYDCGLRKRK
jgi:hypothetical protein